jgi:hypothetical protein
MAYIPLGTFPHQQPRPPWVDLGQSLGGHIFAQEIVIAGGTHGVIRSQNFVPGSSGWAIFGDGSAEFVDITVRGDIISGNWDGSDPADLSTMDSGATTGFYLDSSAGAAQFEGDVWLGGDLTMDAGGTFKSLASGNRVEIAGTDPDTLAFFTGDAAEDNSGLLQLIFSGSGGARKFQMALSAPSVNGVNTAAFILLSDATVDDTTGTPEIVFGYSGTSALNPEMRMQNGMQIQGDTDAALSELRPTYSFGGDSDSGLYRQGVDAVSMSAGGVEMMRWNEETNKQVLVGNFGTAALPSIAAIQDPDTGIAWALADALSLSAGGVEMIRLVEGATDEIRTLVDLEIGTHIRADADNAVDIGDATETFRDVYTHTVKNEDGTTVLNHTTQSFTPTLRASTTNPTLGSGSVQTGYWSRVGNWVHVQVYINVGASGFSKGSGVYYFDFNADDSNIPDPLTSLFTSGEWYVTGTCFIWDVSSSTGRHIGTTNFDSTANRLIMFTHGASGAAGASVDRPHAWGQSDKIIANFLYPCA